jgi:hypothetical protein
MAAIMSNQPETYQRVSVPEAATILGMSVATVRRRIRDGSLQAESVHRPQGITYVVLIPSSHATDHDRSDSDQQVGTTARLNQSGQPAGDAIAAMIQATLTPIIGPLVSELAASRQTNEQLSSQLVRQAETIGQLRAENRALLASTAPQPAEPITETPIPLSRRLTRWLVLGLVLVGVLSTVVALLVWPR